MMKEAFEAAVLKSAWLKNGRIPVQNYAKAAMLKSATLENGRIPVQDSASPASLKNTEAAAQDMVQPEIADNIPGIRVRNLCKSYGTLKLFDHLNLFFPDGRITCIMGKSGCGKTTLLNILMGLDRDYTGSITGMPEKKAAVFQEDRLSPAFSALSNVRLAVEKERKGLSRRELEAEILSCFERLGIREAAGKKAAELSGGMRRRTALARALLTESGILFLDEPFKGLDQEAKAAAVGLIREYPGTVLLVTHGPEDAELLGAGVLSLHTPAPEHI